MATPVTLARRSRPLMLAVVAATVLVVVLSAGDAGAAGRADGVVSIAA